jgi:hypothetical protein
MNLQYTHEYAIVEQAVAKPLGERREEKSRHERIRTKKGLAVISRQL